MVPFKVSCLTSITKYFKKERKKKKRKRKKNKTQSNLQIPVLIKGEKKILEFLLQNEKKKKQKHFHHQTFDIS